MQSIQDVDKNKKYNSPPDIALTKGTKIALVNTGSRRRLGARQSEESPELIATAPVTDNGEVDFVYNVQDVATGDVIGVIEYTTYMDDCTVSGICDFYFMLPPVDTTGYLPVEYWDPILVDYMTTAASANPVPTETVPSGATTTVAVETTTMTTTTTSTPTVSVQTRKLVI